MRRCPAEMHDYAFQRAVVRVRCIKPAGHTGLHETRGLFAQRIEWGRATRHNIANSIGAVMGGGRWN